jgi:hypothetical protein
MAVIDTSKEMTVNRDWVKSLALIGICLLLCAVFFHLVQGDATSYYEQRAKTGGYIALPILVPFTLWIIFRLFIPFGPVLWIGPDGFADRRVSSQLIPWVEIKNIVARSEFVTLTLSQSFSKSYSMSFGQRLLKLHRKAGPRHLVVAYWCTATTDLSLRDALITFLEAHTKTRIAATN